MTEPMADILQKHADRLNLIASIDVSGRGGNIFFLTIFDRNREVIGCPLVQYTYTYIDSAFGGAQTIESEAARKFLIEDSYMRLLYADPTGPNGEMISRLGGDVHTKFDRALFRRLIDEYFSSRKSISRRDLVTVPSVAYAVALGRDLDALKFVIVGDAASLREEHVVTGFSGRIVEPIIDDFPNAKLVRLIRDPRATFASPRHQFVNSFGNMYAIKPSNYIARLYDLLRADLRMDNGCVYLYWLLYLRQTEVAIKKQMQLHPGCFTTVLNEDLNTNFPDAMRRLSKSLGLAFDPDWSTNEFVPTIMGAPWAGTGAYNSRYQRAVDSRLANDPDEVASKVTGPNEYVTKRWRQRLAPREIELIEHLFRNELTEFGYDILYDKPKRSDLMSLLRNALLPFVGEMPTFSWLGRGFRIGVNEFLLRSFYAISFVPFYILSRALLFDLVLRRRTFRNGQETSQTEIST